MNIKIEHIALWVSNLELMKNFYTVYFEGKAGNLYHNPAKQYSSYFVSFGSGTRLELMRRPDISERLHHHHNSIGLTHLAFSVGGKECVAQLTERLRGNGFTIVSEPRTTGDGYYESVVADPEGNWVEITE